MRRLSVPGILGPWMLRVARAELPAHFLIGAVPEAAQVLCDLHGTAGGGEEGECDRYSLRAEVGRLGETEELLQLGRGENRAVVAIVEANAAAARQCECRWGAGLDGAPDIMRNEGGEIDLVDARPAMRGLDGDGRPVDPDAGECNTPHEQRVGLDGPRHELFGLLGVERNLLFAEGEGAV